MICRAVNGLSPSQGLQTGSPPLSGLRPTPLLFPLRGCRVRQGSPKTSGVGRSMVQAKPNPASGGNEPWAPSAPTTGGNGFPRHPSLTGGKRAPSRPTATKGRSTTSAHANQLTELLSSPSLPSNLQTLASGCTQGARNVPRTRFSHLPVPCSTSRGRTAHRPLFAPFRRGPVFTAFSLSPLIPRHPSSFAGELGNRGIFFTRDFPKSARGSILEPLT